MKAGNDGEKTKPEDFNKWLTYVRNFSASYLKERWSSVETVETVSAGDNVSKNIKKTGRKIVVCSPHPDDEVLISAMPLRLLGRGNAVVNIALTLGSDPCRKEARRNELDRACQVLGFDWKLVSEPSGFDRIAGEAERETDAWHEKKAILAVFFAAQNPDMVVFPHANDDHPTHVGAHHLVMGAIMDYCIPGKSVLMVETEFWFPLREPNILIGLSDEDVALQITALTRHVGEVSRNAFHLRHPARLMDSARRGSERLSGYGKIPPDFVFGELYRISKMKSGLVEFPKKYLISPPEEVLCFDILEDLFSF